MESILSQLKNCMVFLRIIPVKKWTKCTESCIIQSQRKKYRLLFTPVSISGVIDTGVNSKEYMELIRVNLRSQLNNIDMEQKDGSIVNLGEKYGEKYMNKKGN